MTVFDLPPGQCRGGLLLWYVNHLTESDRLPVTILVNDHRLEHRHDPDRMLTGGWDRCVIPAAALRPGVNRIIFAENGRLRVDPGPGGSSLRSFDGGRTWHADAFGPNRDTAGECMVRLRVRGCPPEGRITSPVIDLAEPDGDGVAAAHAKTRRCEGTTDRRDDGRVALMGRVRRVRLQAACRLPRGAAVALEMRSGDSPMFDPACWTPWQETSRLDRPGRFVQWRATLRASRMDAAPSLTGVTLDAEFEPATPATAPVWEVTHWDRPEIVRSSYAFTALTPHPRAERLVKQYRLNEVIAKGRTDLDRLGLLRQWVHQQWYGWLGENYPYCPSWDPLEILETVKGNWGFGMCTHYAATFVGCAAALGYTARVLIIDHHCLAEVWVSELGRWVCMDPGPDRAYNAMYLIRGEPVNALEIHNALSAGRLADLQERAFPPDEARPMREKYAVIFRRFGVAPRNNHLVQAEPAEREHGYGQYHWDGYLWWTDDADPKYPEYSLQTRRPGDFYWTVDRVRVHLQAAADGLRADFEHNMPRFDRFEVRLDGGSWQTCATPYAWKPQGDDGALEARAVNAFGMAGPPTHVEVRRRRSAGA
jgi:hypothetical protein